MRTVGLPDDKIYFRRRALLYPNLTTPHTYVKPYPAAKADSAAAIDREALRAARESKYAPRIANCVPVEGTYLFHTDFEPN